MVPESSLAHHLLHGHSSTASATNYVIHQIDLPASISVNNLHNLHVSCFQHRLSKLAVFFFAWPVCTRSFQCLTVTRHARHALVQLATPLALEALIKLIKLSGCMMLRYYTLHYYLADDTVEMLENLPRTEA